MNHGAKLWAINKDLREERLATVAHILSEARNLCLVDHRPELGEGPWSLGTRAHERQIEAVRRACAEIPWLEVADDSLRFVFTIAGVPFRFWRGDPARPTERILARSTVEYQLAFDQIGESADTSMWRYTVQLWPDMSVARVFVQQFAASGGVLCSWAVPLEALGGSDLPAPVELAPPVVELADDEEEAGGAARA